MQSLFPIQLQNEPHISIIYVSDFGCPNNGIYKAAQNQNACFYEEGLRDFYGNTTKKMIGQALSRF